MVNILELYMDEARRSRAESIYTHGLTRPLGRVREGG